MRLVAVASLAVVMATPACGQTTVDRRVSAAPAGNVSFHFAARSGVCGDGQSYIRVDGSSWYGSFNDAVRAMPCDAGPVRVVLVRDGRELIRIESYAGPLATDADVTDLGAMPAGEAASYLLGLAARVDGRPGRDAIFPATLADSAVVTRTLLAIARDGDRSREVRRSALSYLVRRSEEPGGLSADEVNRTLSTIARDQSEPRTVREQAVSSLARAESGGGVDALVALTKDPEDSWLAQRAIQSMASSGDPRARQPLRAAAERQDLSDDARASAISGVAGNYATSSDAEFLRGLYKRVSSDRLQDAILNGVAAIGGKESRTWIMSIAKDEQEDARERKRAVQMADRLGMSGADLASLYDAVGDGDVRATIISELAQNGTKAAADKLVSIAKADPMVSNRRRAIQALGKFDDPRVKEALRALVGG